MSQYWICPRLWSKYTAYIIGGGPSLFDLDLSLIMDKNIIGVNDAYLLGEWVDVCIFGDMAWYEKHKGPLLDYNGLKVSCNDKTLGVQGINTLQRKRKTVTTIPGTIGWYNNTGLAAINLATILGCKKIVLLGFDMCFKGGESNWHPNIRDQRPERYNDFLSAFDRCKWMYEQLGVEILNATPDSKLNTFPQVELKDVI